ncbi:protein yeeZ precursor [Photobacterium rosenbergii]|uniref:Protein yeeZ n=1 Tax=Photobacterium rosenbergii TaxID=294936 RepID=A0A2T3NGR9_9GAMM|nr:SDR family oxidoreductase [Photobacterium rosenbergii]PSW14208.1 protein yeeZ precursor [Photobacterium rosenbergii]
MKKGQINKVSICGCGWLGLPLAEHLAQLGIETWGSKQAPEQADKLVEQGIHGVALSLPQTLAHPETLTPQITQFFDTDLLVINVPPGRHEGAADELVAKVKLLSATTKQFGCGRIVFISTTAVYGDCSGVVDESTVPRPNTPSGKAHYELEQYLLDEWGSEAVVLRLSGLIGPNRHPVRFLSGRQGIENGKDKVNLIHQQDCIAAIVQLVHGWPRERVLHLASPDHPSREVYYRQMAKMAGLPLPEFVDSVERNSKVIDASKTLGWLSLTLRRDQLLKLAPEL